MTEINFNSYQSVVNWLFQQLPMYQRQGTSAFKKDLKNILALCEGIGNPQDTFKSIHIAGTNGKGSTAHIIAAGLSITGLKVGLYTSPHYMDYRERVKVNGALMSKYFVKKFVKSHFDLIRKIEPSFFEITVAMAFEYFKDQDIDIAVIETGLGGRLDSTNIITPVLSVITNISLDHESMLGDTIGQIAGEKAGIIKPNIPIIIGEHQDASDEVFKAKAKIEKSSIYFTEDETSIALMNSSLHSIEYKITIGKQSTLLTTDLYGDYQKHNISTALYTLDFISKHQLVDSFIWELESYKSILTNLYSTWIYMGRFQLVDTDPTVIVDSAHNIAGISSVMKSLKQYSKDRLHIVIGFVNDKSLELILTVFPKEASYYFVNADIPRALNAKELQSIAKKFGMQGKAYTSVRRGFAAAKRKANKKDLVYVGGSIFVLAEVMES